MKLISWHEAVGTVAKICRNEPEPSQILFVFPFKLYEIRALHNIFWEIEEKLDRVGDCIIKKYLLTEEKAEIKGENFSIKFIQRNYELDGLRPTHIFIYKYLYDSEMLDHVRSMFEPEILKTVEENTFIIY